MFQSTFTSSSQQGHAATSGSRTSAANTSTAHADNSGSLGGDNPVRSALLNSVLSRSTIESSANGATVSVFTSQIDQAAGANLAGSSEVDSLSFVPSLDSLSFVPSLDSSSFVPSMDSLSFVPSMDSVAGAPIDLASRRLPSPEFDSIAAELAKRSIALDLCLVVPMYNEAKRIAASIKTLAASALSSNRVGFVFVDDGSTDNTVNAARAAIAEFGLAHAQVLVLKANLGKGGAVRAGILAAAASAHYVGYLDADLSLDPSDVAAAFTRMRASDAEVLVGDRIVDATHQPKLRRLASLTFRSLAAIAAPTGVRDTQCAMKLFRANVARSVFEPLQTNGFGFDVEVLVRARAIGARVDELPIAWTHTEGSSVNAAAESYRMVRDVLKVRRALLQR